MLLIRAAFRRTSQVATVLDWAQFYPPETRVLALPNWRNPRLFLPTHNPRQRWADSAFYPAFRFAARTYRLALRTRVATGLGETRQVRSTEWPLGEFVRDVFPQAGSAVVLVGTPGPTQKITVRVLGRRGEVLGYLKYAEREAARKRLQQERRLSRCLPNKAGPEVLAFGPFGAGEALLTSAMFGTRVAATLSPPRASRSFLSALEGFPPMNLEAHPWVRRVRAHGWRVPDRWLEVLGNKRWPIVVQHGDFAPWNLLLRSDGTLGAIDWEYGTLEGFPHLDLAYYLLQVSALIYRRAPRRAADCATRYLIGQPHLQLGREEAGAITRLAAYDAYLKSREDGLPEDADLQGWRRAIWEG